MSVALKRIIILIIAFACFFFIVSIYFAKKASDEVLDSFVIMNDKLEEQNQMLPDYGSDYNPEETIIDLKNDNWETASNKTYSYIDTLKKELLINQERPFNYKKMDNSVAADTLFFTGNRLTQKGTEFVNQINNYRFLLLKTVKPKSNLHKDISTKFNTEDIKSRNGYQNWLRYNFEGFPIIATIARLSSMQADIRTFQNEIAKEKLQ
ncbi:MAG: hypothetical protein HRT68_10525 [Flavobacteriaceae bacterium]|nr:hypothetical protein [Flavobacteriaceae bacterium]